MSKCSLFIGAVFALTFSASSPGLSQSAAQESVALIDWERAAGDLARAPESLKSFRADNLAALDSIKVPVLMSGTITTDATTQLRGQGNSYAIAYRLPEAKLAVLGTSVYLIRPDDQVLSQSGPGSSRVFDHTEDSSDLSFIKYGASYILRISCSDLNDQRCTTDSFLNEVADSLVVIGGRK